MKNTELAWAILVDPRTCFAALRERPRLWFPLLVTMASSAVVVFWYFSIVDFAWLREQMMSGNPRLEELSEAEKAQSDAMLTRNVLMGTSLAGVVIGIPLMRLLESLYYLLAGKLANVQQPFRSRFSLACWTGFPLLLTVLAMAAALLIQENGQVTLEGLQLLSLNELLFRVPAGSRWHSLLSSLTILHPWVWWLTVVGVRVWSGRSWMFSSLFALSPVALVYGAWALFALLS